MLNITLHTWSTRGEIPIIFLFIRPGRIWALRVLMLSSNRTSISHSWVLHMRCSPVDPMIMWFFVIHKFVIGAVYFKNIMVASVSSSRFYCFLLFFVW